MSKLTITLLVVIALAVVFSVIRFLLSDPPNPATVESQGPCVVPAGFIHTGNRVTWNPLSEPGRCATSSAVLVVDNGTPQPIHIAFGTNDIEVKPSEHLAITTPPGPFKLHATRNGEVIADAKINLVENRTYVYAPDVAYTYARRTYTYSQYADIIGGTGPSDEPLPEALLIDAGALEYILEAPPDKLEMSGGSMTKVALHRLETAGVSEQRTVGDLRIIDRGNRTLILENTIALGTPAVAIYIDNAGTQDLSIAIDVSLWLGRRWIEVGKIRGNSYRQLTVPAGKHELVATLAKTTERETIATAAGDTWVWTPTRRREYTYDTMRFGGAMQPIIMDMGDRPPPEIPRARAMPPFQIAVDYVFTAPTSIPGSQWGSQTKTVLRLGRVGDLHREVAREIRALGGKADDSSASECDLFAAKRAANKPLTNAENVAAKMFCR